MKLYHYISGSVFGIVAIGHLLRLINAWLVVLGPWTAPMVASWIGLAIAGCLSIWSFRLIAH